ncbi:hypothetical protein PanWU01x14_305930 [Parasponia andersonii]|uniref:Uncharacterized protein n=1 Tax=Parasponia andersonii TaxID=3476 RepID=A0A2P5AS22_PARAD|nr:hypothetical protein PanWU01x14_305930 [Parasponia andersonii]
MDKPRLDIANHRDLAGLSDPWMKDYFHRVNRPSLCLIDFFFELFQKPQLCLRGYRVLIGSFGEGFADEAEFWAAMTVFCLA